MKLPDILPALTFDGRGINSEGVRVLTGPHNHIGWDSPEFRATCHAVTALPELLEALAAEEAWRNATDSTTYENLRIVANAKRQAALIKAGATL